MALVDAVRIRIDLPHEPGEWVVVRPLGALELDEALRLADGPLAPRQLVEQLERVIVEWSYQVPVSAQAIGRLDVQTAAYVLAETLRRSVVSQDELKNLLGASTEPSPVEAPPRQSS